MKTTSLLKTPIFEVVKCSALPSGMEPVRIEAPEWVTIIVKCGGKLLVEKQLRFGNGLVVEEFPCGQVEPGEDPAAAAVRELREETGIDFDPGKLVFLGAASPNPAFMANSMRWYLADLDVAGYAEAERNLDEDEDIACEWVPVAGFRARVLEKAKTTRREVPAMLLAAMMLFEAQVEEEDIRMTTLEWAKSVELSLPGIASPVDARLLVWKTPAGTSGLPKWKARHEVWDESTRSYVGTYTLAFDSVDSMSMRVQAWQPNLPVVSPNPSKLVEDAWLAECWHKTRSDRISSSLSASS